MDSVQTSSRISTNARIGVVYQGPGTFAIGVTLDKKLYSVVGAVSRISGTLLAGLVLKRVKGDESVPKEQRLTWQTTQGTMRATISARYAGVVLKSCTTQVEVKIEVHPDGTVLFTPINVNTLPTREPQHLLGRRAAPSHKKEDAFKFKSNGKADVAVLKEAIETVNRVAKETNATLTIEEGIVKARIEI